MVEIGTEFRFCWKWIVVGPKWLKSELSSDYLAALDFALQNINGVRANESHLFSRYAFDRRSPPRLSGSTLLLFVCWM
jgi:hypothetical protein